MKISVAEGGTKRAVWPVCIGLVLAVAVVYGQLGHAGFVNYDDPVYVKENPHIQSGLSWTGFIWAFTAVRASNWHPLTWLSYMFDAQFFGLTPGGEHLVNVAFHAANSVVLLFLLWRLTAAFWPSAMVAALFALHPMHVESVAWISERKDVLSTLFWLLATWAYVRAVTSTPKDRRFFILSVVLFALGLMAKPMLVTLPFVLLLLDWWPLRRGSAASVELWLEKWPFFVLTAISSVLTFAVQHATGAVAPLAARSLANRLENTPVAYVRYLEKLFWPAHLGITYPMFKWMPWQIAVAAVLLLGVSSLVWWRRREQPWLGFGWCWFLITLVPVIGLVQVGLQSMADRYAYVPSIGFFVAVVWTASGMLRKMGVAASSLVAAVILGLCAALTWMQAGVWMGNKTLFEHAIRSTRSNYFAYQMLGAQEAVDGHTDLAVEYLNKSIEINPYFADSRNRLARVLMNLGKTDEAMTQLKKAIDLDPTLADAHYNLGYVLMEKGKTGEALDQFQTQVNLDPDNAKAQENMGNVLLQAGLAPDAIAFLGKAAELEPKDGKYRYLLANALFRSGLTREAIGQYVKSVQLQPLDDEAINDLAWILACNPDASVRNGTNAVQMALLAEKNSHGENPVVIGTLAAAYAEAGRFPDAVATEQRARKLALAQTNASLATILETRLHAYEAHRPWRDTNSQRPPPAR